MKCKTMLGALTCGMLLLAPIQPKACGDEIPEKYRKAVEKGLNWLASRQQDKGCWGANGEQYPISMTGLAGMALLMEGSTVKDGKYAAQLRKAVDYLMDKSQDGQRDGLIGDTNIPTEQGRYMYGHGFATLFLASVYGDETDQKKRGQLRDILTRAVKYIGNAQSTQGGWYYTSAKDGHDQDEGSVTITQMQALRACRNAGIPVPKAILDKGIDYLRKSTTDRGGVVYSLGRGGFAGAPLGGERPALTAAAISCGFSAGEYKSELCKKWFKYCATAIPINGAARMNHDEYTHYYYSQALYMLADKGWENLFGPTPEAERLTWTKYRDQMGDHLLQIQGGDGSWPGGAGFSVGPVYSTAVYLTVMQLDRGVLPIYQR